MPVGDSVLLVVLAVAAVIHIAGITILGFLLHDGQPGDVPSGRRRLRLGYAGPKPTEV